MPFVVGNDKLKTSSLGCHGSTFWGGLFCSQNGQRKPRSFTDFPLTSIQHCPKTANAVSQVYGAKIDQLLHYFPNVIIAKPFRIIGLALLASRDTIGVIIRKQIQLCRLLLHGQNRNPPVQFLKLHLFLAFTAHCNSFTNLIISTGTSRTSEGTT